MDPSSRISAVLVITFTWCRSIIEREAASKWPLDLARNTSDESCSANKSAVWPKAAPHTTTSYQGYFPHQFSHARNHPYYIFLIGSVSLIEAGHENRSILFTIRIKYTES